MLSLVAALVLFLAVPLAFVLLELHARANPEPRTAPDQEAVEQEPADAGEALPPASRPS